MSSKEILYGALAVASAVAGWYFNLQFMQQPGAGWADWIRQCLVNPASSSALMDLTAGYVILAIFMLVEAGRIGMRWAWVYVLLTILVSFGTGVALFLLFRERFLRSKAKA